MPNEYLGQQTFPTFSHHNQSGLGMAKIDLTPYSRSGVSRVATFSFDPTRRYWIYRRGVRDTFKSSF
jgi:hypothetical protein